VAILAVEEHLRNQAVLEHFRRAPFAGYRDIVPKVPPEVVGELLWATVDLEPPEHIKAFVIKQRDPTGRVTVGISKRAHVDSVGSAMHSMRPRVPGAFGQLGRFNNLNDFGR